jgi:hypothetical protein
MGMPATRSTYRALTLLTLALLSLPAIAQQIPTVPNPPPYDVISIHPHNV